MTAADKPLVEYFELTYHGLGGAIYMMLADAGIEFEKRTITFDGWMEERQRLIDEKICIRPTLPILRWQGRYYSHQTPILRFLARKIGGRHHVDDDTMHRIDALNDVIMDFRKMWALVRDDAATLQTFRVEKAPELLSVLDAHLAQSDGPYDLADGPSYAAYSLLTTLSDAKVDISGYAHLQTFVDAMVQRPGVKAHLK